MKLLPSLFAISVLLSSTFIGCTSSADNAPDVSGITIAPQFYRMDQKIKQLTSGQLDSLLVWKAGHPEFWSLLLHRIYGIRAEINPADTSFLRQWDRLANDTLFVLLQHKIDSLYADFTPYEAQITQALKYHKYYFPHRKTPDVYLTHTNLAVAQFVFGVPPGKEGIATGLDFYLGRAFPYQYLAPFDPLFSTYNARHFDPAHLVRGTLWALVDDIAGPPQGQRMIDIMVHNGKKLYLLNKFLPETEDSILINYTPKEIQWVQDNAREIWALFLNENLLYETSSKKINTYINPAPTSRSMPPESPGRTANWVGWQIVRQYMARHPNQTLQGLLDVADGQKILMASKYKP